MKNKALICFCMFYILKSMVVSQNVKISTNGKFWFCVASRPWVVRVYVRGKEGKEDSSFLFFFITSWGAVRRPSGRGGKPKLAAMEAGAGEGGRIDSAPRIQMMKDLLTSMGVEEADPKVRALPFVIRSQGCESVSIQFCPTGARMSADAATVLS